MRRKSLLLLLLPAAAVLGGARPFPEGSPIKLESELFPTVAAVNDQRGFAVAMDGEWLAVGARLEDVDGLDNAGAVHLFQFEPAAGAWKEKATLTSPGSQEEGQFGFALSLQGNTLAVSAVGERKVHVFTEAAGAWSYTASREAPAGAQGFGRSVSLDGAGLAVGAADPHGATPGAVYVYSGPSLTGPAPLAGEAADPEERFGHAVALQGATLVVGAPGADAAKGAVYVFERRRGRWVRTARSAPHSVAAGDQLGFSVAIDGGDVAVGAPTEGEDDAGGAWALRREGQAWRWSRLPGSEVPGGQLGHAVDVEGGRIAAGAPFGGGNLFGAVRVFTRSADAWTESATLQAENDDPLDLSGSAVALSGDWVIFGSALGDHGGNAAGSVSSFLCTPGEECRSMGDAVVPGAAAREVFGISVAADGDLFAVGSRSVDPETVPSGSVTVFRKAARGWRQERRLVLEEDPANRFGAAVVLHRDGAAGYLLVIGDPLGDSISGSPDNHGGAVYLFRRTGGKWDLEPVTRLRLLNGANGFGRSVATNGTFVVAGADGAAYVLEKSSQGEWEGTALVPPGPPSPGYGAAVAAQGDTVVVGAPQASRVFVFTRAGPNWSQPVELSGTPGSGFGAALAIDGDTLAVGAPRQPFIEGQQVHENAGAVFLFERSGNGWQPGQSLPRAILPEQGFGSSVALRGGNLVAGAPTLGDTPDDPDGIVLFQREGLWLVSAVVDAIPRIGSQEHPGDRFGSGVAIGDGFFVVTSPGETGGDRVTVFELREEEP